MKYGLSQSIRCDGIVPPRDYVRCLPVFYKVHTRAVIFLVGAVVAAAGLLFYYFGVNLHYWWWKSTDSVFSVLIFLAIQDGTNALMAAASNGHLEAAQKLVKAGAELNKQNSDGHNALMFAYNGRAQVRFGVRVEELSSSSWRV